MIAIENVRLFDEIQDKSRQLAEASQHKSQFLANMSHELRTPLNAILGYTELILDGIYGEHAREERRTCSSAIESNGKHLLGLINDVLDLSKIEAGQLTLSLADYSIKDVVHNVVQRRRAAGGEEEARASRSTCRPTCRPATATSAASPRSCSISSATPSSSPTQARSRSRPPPPTACFSVAVHDTGPGISAADQSKLFQEFQQADNSITKHKGGTGLGLAISKRIIEMHGGNIWVEFSVGQGLDLCLHAARTGRTTSGDRMNLVRRN